MAGEIRDGFVGLPQGTVAALRARAAGAVLTTSCGRITNSIIVRALRLAGGVL